ncbi:concanavalin A-like lectin/glucanase domain-containing protein [Polychytrium aggregatum]|uniref:concanavalin A-like lectin/glucanase domain-containing protein n=1 Tax=Polychytrium aggregatum TaxID=110093 RepID=UPI0022FEA734|nr:concanavalin A-like lectin/glucanase domain-containing protein [Polychytrium aggregatum]KAI9206973.1 concanavalin A-like lectin/glucanase domain-containing protein [Polychytrium aggregatum]
MRLSHPAVVVLAAVGSAGVALAAANSPANCVSGRYYMNDTSVVYTNNNKTASPPFADAPPSKYAFTIDYNPENAQIGPNGLTITLNKPPPGGIATGSRLSTSFHVLHARITTHMRCAAEQGLITTFITMSDSKDEIDYEIVGAQVTQAQSNVFYQGYPEYGVWSATHNLPSGTIDQYHDYTIDWNSDRILWQIDNTTVRNFTNTHYSTNPALANQTWFPNTPSLIQFSLWDSGDDVTNAGQVAWSGGPPSWSQPSYNASWAYVDIQCYDDNNSPVSAWPVGSVRAQSSPLPSPSSSSTTTTVQSATSSQLPTASPSATPKSGSLARAAGSTMAVVLSGLVWGLFAL